jgi:hypothetical protein
MQQRKPLTRNTPMVRTPFKRKAPVATAGVLRVAAVQREVRTRTPMKSRRRALTKIQKAARGRDCTVEIIGVCNRNPETVVLCHDNRTESGKGMGLKAPDTAACFGCSSCHDVLDGRAPRPPGMTLAALYARFDAAVEKTHAILRAQGLIA